MKREIKFRGYQGKYEEKDGLWIIGDLIQYTQSDKKYAVIMPHKNLKYDEYPVRIESVGQYTGLKDKNEKEIYEGDIIRISHPCWSERGEVKFSNGAFIFEQIFSTSDSKVVVEFTDLVRQDNWEVNIVGNIHENPVS